MKREKENTLIRSKRNLYINLFVPGVTQGNEDP